MGGPGALAEILFNSQTIQVNGSFSQIGFAAAFAGKHISKKTRGPFLTDTKQNQGNSHAK